MLDQLIYEPSRLLKPTITSNLFLQGKMIDTTILSHLNEYLEKTFVEPNTTLLKDFVTI